MDPDDREYIESEWETLGDNISEEDKRKMIQGSVKRNCRSPTPKQVDELVDELIKRDAERKKNAALP